MVLKLMNINGVYNMIYMGSKRRIAKDILRLVLRNRLPNQWYVEPFVGGGNVIEHVANPRIGADNNKYVIACLKAIAEDTDWIPRESNRETYNYIRECYKGNITEQDDTITDALIGYYGVVLSYGAKWFASWVDLEDRDYVMEGYRNAIKQSPKLKGIIWKHSHFANLEIPDKSIIYCDPPYKRTTKYKDSFNHIKFWNWCRLQRDKGHQVFVSELDAPDDWKCIWSKDILSIIQSSDKYHKMVERLFI